MKPIHFEYRETAVKILSEDEYHKVAKNAIFDARETIQTKIHEDPFFKITYDPYLPFAEDDPLIKRMCEASILANVGPMAGVAGAIASYAVERMSEAGAEFAIVENGGDIALKIDRDIAVGLYIDDPAINDIGLGVRKRDGIFGICSSSGRIGPSVSLGNSMISTVISDDAVLADACATALGNAVGSPDTDAMTKALEKIGAIDGVEGALVVCDGKLGMCGDVPQLIRREINKDAITRIEYEFDQ